MPTPRDIVRFDTSGLEGDGPEDLSLGAKDDGWKAREVCRRTWADEGLVPEAGGVGGWSAWARRGRARKAMNRPAPFKFDQQHIE